MSLFYFGMFGWGKTELGWQVLLRLMTQADNGGLSKKMKERIQTTRYCYIDLSCLDENGKYLALINLAND